MNMLADMAWPQWMLSVLMIVVCLILMLVVLVQRGRGQGLAGAFGGGGGGGGAFGAKTGDVFTWITVIIAMLFLLLNVIGNFTLDQTPVAAATPGAADITDIQIVPPGELPVDVEGKPEISLQGTTLGGGEPIKINLGEPAAAPEEKPSEVTPPAGTEADTPAVTPSGTDAPSGDGSGSKGGSGKTDEG